MSQDAVYFGLVAVFAAWGIVWSFVGGDRGPR